MVAHRGGARTNDGEQGLTGSTGPPETDQELTEQLTGTGTGTRPPPPQASGATLVTGIGASAGGLAALEDFFRNAPGNLGLGYVVVTHMDPRQKSILPEILQRYTGMPVEQVENGMRVDPNRVYVTPPNTYIALLDGIFSLQEAVQVRGMRMPIDFFFRQLAQDRDSRAVGVVLSGMGHDGVLGVRALKDRLGMIMAQDPASADYPSMPRCTIKTGLVDFVAPADELPQILGAYAEFFSRVGEAGADRGAMEAAIRQVQALLQARTARDFSVFAPAVVRRRLERRMRLVRIADVDEYLLYVRQHPEEVDRLAQEIPIAETRFFRNAEAWDVLQERGLVPLAASRPPGTVLRAWVPGCRGGEEVYSVAIALREAIDRAGRSEDLDYRIFASDVDRDAIATARNGRYIANIEADVPPARLERFFRKEGEMYQIRADLRERVVFSQHDLFTHPPFTHLDLLDVRNVIPVLDPGAQQKLAPLLEYALAPGGLLFVDPAENLDPGIRRTLRPLDESGVLLQQDPMSPPTRPLSSEVPTAFRVPLAAETLPSRVSSLDEQVNGWLLAHYVPPAVTVNEKGEILFFHGRTGPYLEPAEGAASLNVLGMAREGLRIPLASALRAAVSGRQREVREHVNVSSNGDPHRIRLTVEPLDRMRGAEDLMLVVFEEEPPPGTPETPPPPLPQGSLEEVGRELSSARRELQETREEAQASQEELQSANEELQSANEELKSMNEELTTSKEELQSLNEELLSVNAEHQTRIEELARSNDDMGNLLRSTEIAILFLDSSLRVRRYTEPATRIVSLMPQDLGRPITDLKMRLLENSLVADARQVLRTLQVFERQVQAEDGHWYSMRIFPYRTAENRIDGLGITFIDVSSAHQLEASRKDTVAAWRLIEEIAATIRDPILVLDAALSVLAANRAYYDAFGGSPEATVGKYVVDLAWAGEELRALLADRLPAGDGTAEISFDRELPGGLRRLRVAARRVTAADSGGGLILLVVEVSPVEGA
jgi:two-component system CheB/CheR fusion protein